MVLTRLEKSVKIGEVLLGAILLVVLTAHGLGRPTDWTPLVILAVITWALHYVHVDISLGDLQRMYFFWDVAFYASVFMGYSMGSVAWIIFSASLWYEVLRLGNALRRGRRINSDAVLSNFAYPFVNVIYVPFVVHTYQMLTQGEGLLEGQHNVLALLAAVGVFLVLATLTDTLHSLIKREREMSGILSLWRTSYANILLHLAMLAPLGVVFAILFQKHSPVFLLLGIPVVVVQQSVKARRDVLRDTEVVIEVMVGVLEERDQYTFGHSERVSVFSEAIAVEMGLSDGEVEQVRKAGRIHDIGKIDVPDAVLRKPGGLDAEELVKMRSHTERNYWYLGKYISLGRHIPFELAAYHHERYDGHGYILGLKGDEIPLGSRIISVADTYDAMTSDRPYRKGLPEDEAMRRLREAAGTQLDPDVVAAFIRLHQAGRIATINRGFKQREPQQG
ncbi:MAG TPA: HD-GYP domain-containing protein [Candidatus Xenobia bacterium]